MIRQLSSQLYSLNSGRERSDLRGILLSQIEHLPVNMDQYTEEPSWREILYAKLFLQEPKQIRLSKSDYTSCQ